MEQTFKIKFSLFGVQKIANVKAKTLEEAKEKLNKSILEQVQILSTEYKEPTLPKNAQKMADEFLRNFGKFFKG